MLPNCERIEEWGGQHWMLIGSTRVGQEVEVLLIREWGLEEREK